MIKRIGDLDFVFLPCQKVVQPIGNLYVGVLSWQIIERIAYVNPRIFMGYDDEGKEVYVGIQRDLSPDRKKQITEYIKDLNATFPTAILLNIPFEKVLIVPLDFSNTLSFNNVDVESIDKGFSAIVAKDQIVTANLSWLIFPFKEGIAQIIDGQHRMSGFEKADSNLEFDLPVTFFLNQDISDQAEMFAMINGKQTRVTSSLVYELFGISPQRSPYTVASKIVKLLNESEQSPLKQSIKILGRSSDRYNGFITQSTIAKIIITLICGDLKQAEEDKRLMRRDEVPPLTPTLTNKRAILRRYFIKGNDEVIFKVLINFFNAVSRVFSFEWSRPDSVLKKTIGITALTRVMARMIETGLVISDLSEDYFTRELSPYLEINFNDIQLSSKGVKQLVDLFSVVE